MKGIRRDRYGYRVYVKVGNLQREKRYPADTAFKTMQAWRDETRVALRKVDGAVSARGDTLRADAARYLAQVKHLTSYGSRVCEIHAWTQLYGDVPRRTLTAEQVRLARVQWLDEQYAPKTINHRVRALRHLFHTLDGKRAPTPCDEITRLEEPKPDPKFVPIQTIKRVAKKLSDPKTRARFMVLTSTGQRPAQLKRAEKSDVDLRRRIWIVRPAKRGNPIPVFLTDDMRAAWQAFIAANAWGHFDGSDYAKALYAAGWPKHIRPYNAKHTVAITLAEANAEWEDIRDWFGHTDIKTTRIYTGLVMKRLKRTGELLDGRLGWSTDQRPRKSDPTSRGTSPESVDEPVHSRKSDNAVVSRVQRRA